MHQNQGYYVFIHEDNSPTDVTTTDILSSAIDEGFEWDEELVETADREDEDWSSLYRWYAQMLEQTEDTVDTSSGSSFKISIDHFAKKQRTAAHYAAEQGHAGVLRLLIQTNSKIDSWDIDGYTPLHLASKCGQISVIRVLLEAEVELNRCTLNVEQFTSLHIAAASGYVNIIDLLLLAGAILEPRDSEERTPLQSAIEHNKVDAVIRLIQAGSNVNVEDIRGRTPLQEAIYRGVPVIEALLAAGARIQPHHYLLHFAVSHKKIELMQLLIKYGSNVNLRDDNGDSPLLLAIREGDVKLVNILVNNGALVDYPNSLTGSTPLHEAVDCSKDYKTFEDIFSCLRDFDVDLNAICFSGGDTPLFRAILLERDEIAKLLIKHGADVNLCSMQHCVLDNLTLALSRESMSIVRLLVLAGANPPSNWERVPRPLTHIARLVLRANMPSKRIFRCIQALPLPVSLKEFLMFSDDD